ncbi:hypothetical protein EVU96_24875 [Bacillus infantis]|uniref:phage baseplate protein n=1 Tax=Bacillus infantis TaxID=324767 RepID=UPI00101D38F7|nr:hypothetical protein [Bacillus infantis]RYI25202.1 hypothetical protein EVU96_24875 [Bacillus infantis]
MPNIGDVLIDVISNVRLGENSSTTDHALEDGEQITDHVESSPITLEVEGIILDKADEKLLKIRKYRQTGEILSFNYRSKLQRVVITSFTPEYDKTVKDGYYFSMSLKQIRVAKAPSIINVSKDIKQQVQKVSNAGRKQLK